MMTNCPDSYSSAQECADACAYLPADGAEGDTDGNTLQCRIYHGGAPAVADGELHCPHASFTGDLVCAEEISGGGVFPGAFPSGFTNSFVLTAIEDSAYRIYTFREDDCRGGANRDTRLKVYSVDAEGERTLVEDNDDVGGGSYCSEVIGLFGIGTYDVVVEGYLGGGVDQYDLHVVYLPTVALGEACVSMDTPIAICDDEGFCEANADDDTSGTCVARLEVGLECDDSSQCAENTYCYDDVCSVYPVEGEGCRTAEDLCPEDTYCFQESFGADPVCTAYPNEGDACTSSNDQCQGDTYCFGSFSTGTCTALPELGDPCSTSNDRCPEESYCFGSYPDYFCTALPELGDACSTSNDRCPEESYCGGSFPDYSCRPYPQIGEECRTFPDLCPEGSSCEGSFADGYLCTLYPDLGEACNQFDDLCIQGVCIEQENGDDICALPPALGEACDPSADLCTEGQCHAESNEWGTCTAAPAEDGDACDLDYGCPEGLACAAGEESNLGICQAPACGDGSVSDGEECDDGNEVDGDGCSSLCLNEYGVSIEPGDETSFSFAFSGSLTDTDENWVRIGDDCSTPANGDTYYYDAFTVSNNTASEAILNAVVETTFDGFIFIYEGDFDPSISDNCIDANDDFGGTRRSGLTNYSLEAGVTITVVVTTYGSSTTGDYTLTVAPPVPLEAGEECDRFNDQCGDGLYCDGNFSDGYTCVPPPGLGEECNRFDDRCSEGTCTRQPNFAPSLCLLDPQVGEACTEYQECVDSQCFIIGDADEGNCTAAPVAGGDFCHPDFGCPSGFDCIVDEGADLGTCIAAACGDSTVTDPEQCDDGNADNGDGCDSLCTNEVTEIITGERSSWAGGIPEGEVDYYDLTIEATSNVIFETAGCNEGEFDSFLEIYTLNEDGSLGDFQGDDDDGNDLDDFCSRFIGILDAGTYRVVVTELGAFEMPSYTFSSEIWQDVSAGGTFAGSLAAGGKDLYKYIALQAEEVTFTSHQTGDSSECGGIDTQLTVYSVDAEGVRTEVGYNDDSFGLGLGTCSSVTVSLEPGLYEAVVNEYGNNDEIESYELDVTVTE
jgi:cysteine-rich repeat protein